MCWLFGGVEWNTWIIKAVPNVLLRFMLHWGAYTCLLTGIVLPLMYVLYHVLQDADEQHQMLTKGVKHFSVGSLKCRFETDRAFVLSEIQKTFGDNATFEKFVIDWLWPDFMRRHYSRNRSSVVSYHHFLLVAQLPHMIAGLDFFLVTLMLKADNAQRRARLCFMHLQHVDPGLYVCVDSLGYASQHQCYHLGTGLAPLGR